ncbi:hypothetical protein [Actinoallomurus sp. CA-150999]|uniref:hypothetical protein n=1 Tax=Actinoallomurus sp. CA-150999 TaxID=3239887 RepID=UPI003D907358
MAFAWGKSEAVARGLVTVVDSVKASAEVYGPVVAAMHRLVPEKRTDPGADVASRMVTHAFALTDEALVADMVVLGLAGQEPTANWIGDTPRSMLTDDWLSPEGASARRSTRCRGRTSRCGTTSRAGPPGSGGRHIKVGDSLIMCPAGANADPYVRPTGSTGSTANYAHLSFAHGSHGCPHPAHESSPAPSAG